MVAESSDKSGGLSPREARKLQRLELGRTQILDTAEDLFGKRGYHSTGLKDVAEQCEFSVGSIYNFFASKDELYAAVLRRHGTDDITAEIETAVEGPASSALDRLILLAEYQVNYFRKYPGWGRLMTQIMTPNLQFEDLHPRREGYAEGYLLALRLEAELIEKGQKAGTIRPGTPLALAGMFSALVTNFHVRDFDDSAGEENPDLDEFLVFLRDAFERR